MGAARLTGDATAPRRGGALRHLPRLGWLVLVWLALWGDLSWANVLSGVAVAAFVLVVVPPQEQRLAHRIAPVAALTYLAVFARDLVVATAEVAVQVFWPRGRLRPAVLEVPLRSTDPALLSLVSNTITLTPGTLTVETDPEHARIWVHVLHLQERPGAAEDVVRQAQALERHGARVLGVDLPADGAGRAGARSREEG